MTIVRICLLRDGAVKRVLPKDRVRYVREWNHGKRLVISEPARCGRTRILLRSWVERRSFDLFSFIHEAKIFDDFTVAGTVARDNREAIVGDIASPIHDLLPNTIKTMSLT